MSGAPIGIRDYAPADAAVTLGIFLRAITVTAAADYSPAQIAAWARPAQRDLAEWDRGMHGRGSFVAVIDGVVGGFSDVGSDGCIDMMFVSPGHGRRGVGRALLAEAEARARRAGVRELRADVSVTARPFFEAFGFAVRAEQHPVTAGVRLTNYLMVRPLAS